MSKRSLALAVSSTTLVLGLVSPALARPQDFVGTWVNTNRSTSGITRFIVTSTSPNTLRIQVFGKCHPSDCNWGTTQLITYGSNVQDRDHKFATANYRPGFSSTLLTFELNGSSRREITLRNFTQFLDKSGRQNYSSLERFRR
jgi:ribosomal protein L31